MDVLWRKPGVSRYIYTGHSNEVFAFKNLKSLISTVTLLIVIINNYK